MSGPVLERALRSAGRLVQHWSAAGRDMLYPPACAACRTGLAAASIDRLCGPCRGRLLLTIADRCHRCSAPVGPHLDTQSGCVHCRNERWTFGRAYSLGPYADGLREACLKMKRPGTEPLAAALAEELARKWQTAFKQTTYDLIVPVPHHWRHRLWRTQLVPVTLARTLSQQLKIPLGLNVLRKVRFTKLQATLTATERRKSLRGAFRGTPGVRIAGGRVMIVDDVLTTGTTADRVAHVLKEMGADSVDAMVVARGLGH